MGFVATLVWGCQGILSADDSVVSATIDRSRIPINQTAVLTVTVSGGNSERPEIPDLRGFSIYSSGQSQNISIINGQMSSSATYTYVLQPRAVGQYMIPPIQVTQDGKVYKTDPIAIEVVQAADVKMKEEGKGREPAIAGQGVDEGKEQFSAVFCRANVDKKKVVVGEQLIYTFWFYRRVNLLDQPQYAPPKFTHFWMEDLPPEKVYYEILGGQRYVVSEVNVALFPTTSGRLTIEPAQIQCQVPTARSARDPFSFFDEDPFKFFNSDPFQVFSGESVRLRTDPVMVEVEELPSEEKPTDFTGAVGHYTLTTTLDKKEIDQNQPVTLAIVLEGEGHIQGITAPKLDLGSSFKLYDSGESSDLEKVHNVVRGKKVFKKVLIPVEAGSLTIPGISFSFYNPKAQSYETTHTEPIVMNVRKGKEEPLSLRQEEAVVSSRPLQEIGRDIRFIKTGFSNFRNFERLPSAKVLWGSLVLPFSLLGLTFVLSWRRSRIHGNYHEFLSKNAYSTALKKLVMERKKHYRKARGAGAFNSAAIEKILLDYLSAKMNMPLQSYQFDEIASALTTKYHVNDRGVKDLQVLLEELRFSRFASSDLDVSKFHDCWDKAKKVLRELDEEL